MPSPLAHCALAFAAWPPVRDSVRPQIAPWRRHLLLLMVLGAFVAPDGDIALNLLIGRSAFETHGAAVHSLAAGVPFAILFALACRVIAPVPFGKMALVGLLAYWSHVLMDACTHGRGVAMFWPLWSERVVLPVPLFVGVEHSNWQAWGHHALTITTEAAFTAAVWFVCARWRRSRAPIRRESPLVGDMGQGAMERGAME